jgi:hypothetical protein
VSVWLRFVLHRLVYNISQFQYLPIPPTTIAIVNPLRNNHGHRELDMMPGLNDARCTNFGVQGSVESSVGNETLTSRDELPARQLVRSEIKVGVLCVHGTGTELGASRSSRTLFFFPLSSDL